MDNIILEVNEEYIGVRIDVFLAKKLTQFTRSAIQKVILENNVTVNGKIIKYNYKLKKNDSIELLIVEAKELNILAENIPLDILFEDEHILVINKQKGMVVHPAPGHYEGTLVNALMHHCKGQLSGINGVLRPGIVHRIDKDTSGILVVAKTNESHVGLSLQLEKHTMVRVYNAIAINNLKEDTGTIDKPIGRHPKERKKMAVTNKNSKHAITHYKVLERLSRYTFVEVTLETGRTHQIRVHMHSIGNPLLGDELYGKVNASKFGFYGQALHATVLGFIHPYTKKYMEFTSSLPPEFEIALQKMR
jgi:23S rRNA pseudouridine1911/1915/1917 synthase